MFNFKLSSFHKVYRNHVGVKWAEQDLAYFIEMCLESISYWGELDRHSELYSLKSDELDEADLVTGALLLGKDIHFITDDGAFVILIWESLKEAMDKYLIGDNYNEYLCDMIMQVAMFGRFES